MPNGRTFLEGDFARANQAMSNLANELIEEFGLGDTLTRAYGARAFPLTGGAVLTLLIPIVEAAEAQDRRGRSLKADGDELNVDLTVVERTVSTVLDAMGEEASSADRLSFGGQSEATRSSLSVFQAIAARWCRVPPICGRRD